MALKLAPQRVDEAQDEDLLVSLVPYVRAVVARHVGPDIDLDDAVQEALVEVALALPAFRGGSKITTFVHTIAMRAASKHRQRRSRRARVSELVEVADARDPESIASQRQSARRLYAALDGLSDTRREAFVLCAIEQLSHEEAARIAGTSIETLRQRLKRARADLERVLRNEGGRS